jgi:hypothetical protein
VSMLYDISHFICNECCFCLNTEPPPSSSSGGHSSSNSSGARGGGSASAANQSSNSLNSEGNLTLVFGS